jgi:hypothetical protein
MLTSVQEIFGSRLDERPPLPDEPTLAGWYMNVRKWRNLPVREPENLTVPDLAQAVWISKKSRHSTLDLRSS